jgi:hypothetical protein
VLPTIARQVPHCVLYDVVAGGTAQYVTIGLR